MYLCFSYLRLEIQNKPILINVVKKVLLSNDFIVNITTVSTTH